MPWWGNPSEYPQDIFWNKNEKSYIYSLYLQEGTVTTHFHQDIEMVNQGCGLNQITTCPQTSKRSKSICPTKFYLPEYWHFSYGVLLMSTHTICFPYKIRKFIHLKIWILFSELWKKVREKSRECHNHKPQPFPDTKRKRKQTKPNKHKSNKRTKSTKISSLFPKRGNRNAQKTEKHTNKITPGKTWNKSPCRINHKQQRERLTPGPPP